MQVLVVKKDKITSGFPYVIQFKLLLRTCTSYYRKFTFEIQIFKTAISCDQFGEEEEDEFSLQLFPLIEGTF
jgi:hypothetical protein